MEGNINGLIEQITGDIERLRNREKELKAELIPVQKELRKYSASLKILKGKNQILTPEERGARIRAGRERKKEQRAQEDSR